MARKPATPAIPNVFWSKGRAYARKRIKGQVITASLDTDSPAIARRRVRQWLADLNGAQWGDGPLKTFDDCVLLFTERHLPRKRPKTQRIYLDSLLIMTPYFSGKTMDRITGADLATYEAERLKTVSPSTVLRDLACLSVVFEVAKTADYCLTNPVQAYIKAARRRGLVENDARERYLSEDEEAELLRAIRSDAIEVRPMQRLRRGKIERYTQRIEHLTPWVRDMTAAFVALSIDTGLREQELLTLAWTNVYLDQDRIYVPKDRAKSKRGRWVPLLPRAKQTLETLQRMGRNSVFVIHQEHGKPFTGMWHRLQKVIARTTLHDIRVHDLRRTCGCRLIQRHRLQMAEVSQWLGHSSVVVTERSYAFLRIDDLQRALGASVQRLASDRASD